MATIGFFVRSSSGVGGVGGVAWLHGRFRVWRQWRSVGNGHTRRSTSPGVHTDIQGSKCVRVVRGGVLMVRMLSVVVLWLLHIVDGFDDTGDHVSKTKTSDKRLERFVLVLEPVS